MLSQLSLSSKGLLPLTVNTLGTIDTDQYCLLLRLSAAAIDRQLSSVSAVRYTCIWHYSALLAQV